MLWTKKSELWRLIPRTTVPWITPVCFRERWLFLKNYFGNWKNYQLSDTVSGLELSCEWGEIPKNYPYFPSVITVDYPSEDCKPILRKPTSAKYLTVIPRWDFKTDMGIDELLWVSEECKAFCRIKVECCISFVCFLWWKGWRMCEGVVNYEWMLGILLAWRLLIRHWV